MCVCVCVCVCERERVRMCVFRQHYFINVYLIK